MPNKKDGSPQTQRGGRKVAKYKLAELTDPSLILESKLGPGELLPSLSRQEKIVFQKATGIAYERWHETTQENIRDIVSELLIRLKANLHKIPPAYLTLNVVQLLQHAYKGAPNGSHGSSNVNINLKATPAEVSAFLFGKPNSPPPQPRQLEAQAPSVTAHEPVNAPEPPLA